MHCVQNLRYNDKMFKMYYNVDHMMIFLLRQSKIARVIIDKS